MNRKELHRILDISRLKYKKNFSGELTKRIQEQEKE